ncbi:lytic transglycosylase domain-containing protein [Desulfoluna spongiiphila]|nr:lytic transglycosylase domain-containing protein [Desulfoluna spongiiphila]
MIIKKLVLNIALISAVATGCTTQPLFVTPKIPQDAIVTQQEKGEPATHVSAVATDASGSLLPGKEISEDNVYDDLAAMEQEYKLQDEDDQSLDAAERALDLCRNAQKMWENGDADDAIATLDAAYRFILSIGDSASLKGLQQKDEIRFMICKRLHEIYVSKHTALPMSQSAIPTLLNKHVEAEIKRFTTYEKRYFADSLRRSGKYIAFIRKELEKEGLPGELAWLPLIESGFNLKALSTENALGLWQFVPVTANRFSLEKNLYVDERLDPFKSTVAAVRYFKILHRTFGDWETVLAAYNCGEGRVLRTIKGQRHKYLDNFWDLYNRLPRETARFVPRFLATIQIVNNLEKYGFDQIQPERPVTFDVVKINKQLSLKSIAKTTGIPFSSLAELNTELKHAILPDRPYELRVPKGTSEKLLSVIDTIPESSRLAIYRSVRHHKVKSGDSLYKIARDNGTTVRALSEVNNINQRDLLQIGNILIIPADRYKRKKKKQIKISSKQSVM